MSLSSTIQWQDLRVRYSGVGHELLLLDVSFDGCCGDLNCGFQR